ncbi:hypothetical protein O181_116324 [Austropuccinia psidii MF-1]|uniref:Uncharacterized protein n=1 Tax=Austropuccinia psidii MF-1 TaxID=1389203 RepID=A0A9Q3KB96_9BASI|nr:hypothetical protein [Austropuccinia psidii MF-1]
MNIKGPIHEANPSLLKFSSNTHFKSSRSRELGHQTPIKLQKPLNKMITDLLKHPSIWPFKLLNTLLDHGQYWSRGARKPFIYLQEPKSRGTEASRSPRWHL